MMKGKAGTTSRFAGKATSDMRWKWRAISGRVETTAAMVTMAVSKSSPGSRVERERASLRKAMQLGCPLAHERHEQDEAGGRGKAELEGDVPDHGRVEPGHRARRQRRVIRGRCWAGPAGSL